MKRVLTSLGICFLAFSAFAVAKEAKKSKPGPLTGTWECMSHGSPQGDMEFTLYLDQNKNEVTGSVASPMGSTQITSGTLVKKNLEIHIDTPQGNYLLTGKLNKDQLAGEWSADTGEAMKGTWEGKKTAETSAQPTP